MMTTVSAIVGTLPIAIGVGTSAASRRPLGIAVVGGFAFSQIVTLYVTPVFYRTSTSCRPGSAERAGARLVARRGGTATQRNYYADAETRMPGSPDGTL